MGYGHSYVAWRADYDLRNTLTGNLGLKLTKQLTDKVSGGIGIEGNLDLNPQEFQFGGVNTGVDCDLTCVKVMAGLVIKV